MDIADEFFESFTAILSNANGCIDAEARPSPPQHGVSLGFRDFVLFRQGYQELSLDGSGELFSGVFLHTRQGDKGAIRSKGSVGDQPMLVWVKVKQGSELLVSGDHEGLKGRMPEGGLHPIGEHRGDDL